MKWIKFAEQLPPSNGTEILIAMRNKNMASDGIWLFDVCFYLGGNIHDNDNWEGKINWESPLYWCYIEEPEIDNMKYKAGDRVLIKSIDWYNQNQIDGIVTISNPNGDFNFTENDAHLCGKIVTIEEVWHNAYYTLENDPNGYFWVDEMIDCKVEE